MKFTGTAARPLQVVRVSVTNDGPEMSSDPSCEVTVRVHGAGIRTPRAVVLAGLSPGEERTAEVGVQVADRLPAGTERVITAIAEGPHGRTESQGQLTVAEPGWTMWMVSHFHYDPVWWGTQGQYTQTWQLLPDEAGGLPDTRTAFELVRLHLDEARSDPDYKFVLAEIDYLKPHFDAYPEDRADLRELISRGQIEIVGGSYNEPNTNLTCAELTIRNAVYGLAFHRQVLGADSATAWMLDAFGFDPSYPGLMADAGLTSSAWARGPFHQWGPSRSAGGNELMQFPSEFEWLAPSGQGLLTSYMPNHYSAGWITQHAADLAGAEKDAYLQFRQLAAVAASKNVLLPVGADHVVPSTWATAIQRHWNASYLWPKFVTALPRDYFAAVRQGVRAAGSWLMPQTRDMNPVYTGKDVSYIDTKQAHRAAEVAVLDGERLATAAWLAGADYPAASLDRAWRLLVFGAHHDAVTGTESDQVYLDLLAGWREAHDRGARARDEAAGYLAAMADTAHLAAGVPGGTEPGGPSDTAQSAAAATGSTGPGSLAPRVVVVLNTQSWPRSGLARVTLRFAAPGWGTVALLDDGGMPVSYLAEGIASHRDGSVAEVTVTFRADDVPAVGMRAYLAAPAGQGRSAAPRADAAGWQPADGTMIENDALLVAAQAGASTLARITDKRLGAELLAGPGNELILQQEYPTHPRWGEGPWLLCPTGAGQSSADVPATVRAERCPIGSRLLTSYRLGDLAVTQEALLFNGAERVEFRTHVDGSIGQDRLLRVRFAANVPGGLPVYQSGLSVLGRPPGPAWQDIGEHGYTLDSPAHEWFGVGSTARVALSGTQGGRTLHAIGVAEVIAPAGEAGAGFAPRAPATGSGARQIVRELMVALARQGVTATCSAADGPRYGWIEVDSNLPDVRIVVGGPDQNSYAAQVLAAAGSAAAAALAGQLGRTGSARLWIPADRSRADAFGPGADLRGIGDLPVLILAGADLRRAVGALCADLADAEIEIPPDGVTDRGGEPALAPYSVALLNRGTPGSLVTPQGELLISLMRACSTWPSGVWIDGDRRTVPDGSSFSWQHWSHTFEYALAAGPGDWRSAGFPQAGQDYAHELICCETAVHAGPLPSAVSLASVEPPGAALMTMKPHGNPLAPLGQPDRAAGITVRLRDLAGLAAPGQAQVRLFTGARQAAVTGPTEDGAQTPASCRDGIATLTVPPCGTVTAAILPGGAGAAPPPVPDTAGDTRLRMPPEPPPEPPPGRLTGLPEPVQPVFTRYWLHGKGPAPAGNLPVAVHLSPALLALQPGESGTVRLTVAAGPAAASGVVTAHVPDGLDSQPAGPLRYDLASNGFTAWDLEVTAAPGTAAGRRFLAAQITDQAGQLLEDAVTVAVGEPAPAPRSLPRDQQLPLLLAGQLAEAAEADLVLVTGSLALPPGGCGTIAVRLDNHTMSAIRGEAQLLSPFGSWASVTPHSQPFSAPASGSATVTFTVSVPHSARPGQRWWALAKLMYFGRLRYSDAVTIDVTAPAS